MRAGLLQVAIATETDVVLVRKRTHRLAALIGFDQQDQNRITSAVSEIARNALEYAGGGRAEFRLETSGRDQEFVIVVHDRGPGIAELEATLDGSRSSPTGLGLGMIGARRLMDSFDVQTSPGAGTTVRLGKKLAGRTPPITGETERRIRAALAADGPADAMEEIRRQNQQILLQMEELRIKQDDLQKLNQELQDTNRGVVALYAELDERAGHLRRADELKSRFLSHMSHEFRTPLNSILALSQLLLMRSDGELTEEQDKQVRFIRKAAEDLTELVNDLLDLAKVEAGKTAVTPAPFTADSLFGALRGMLRPLLVDNGVALVFEDTAKLPLLDTDEAKLSQILRNFISNAIKFTEQGEVRVWADADPQADTISFHVGDTGIGIAEEDLGVIFQEFGQVNNRLQKTVKGTGLGLPLARKLAELLGGRITVESAPGNGSTFTVTLPRVYGREQGDGDEGTSWSPVPGKLPVLLVEDNPADALVVERFLVGTPYHLVHVRSVREAERALHQFVPAAILLDILLTNDESWRLLLQVRHDESLSDVPLVVTSATGEDRKALHLGADDYLAKPLEPERLLDTLDRLTGRASIRVLLVDDDAVSHYLVQQLLPRSDFSLTTAADGQQALDALLTARPDVILLDLSMPGMDGYTFMQRVGSMPAFRGIPIVVLTSMVLSADDRDRLRPAARILSKSELQPGTLSDLIQSVLHPTQAALP